MKSLAVPLLLLLSLGALGAYLRRDPRPAVDRAAAEAVRGLGVPEGLLQGVSAALAGGMGWALAAGVACLLAALRGYRHGLLALAAFAAAHGVATVAKALFDRARPDADVLAGGTSYPSGHVATATALAAAVALPWLLADGAARRALGLTAVLGAAALMGISRVGLGRHFPTDVVGGACLGLAVVLALARVLPLRGGEVLPDPARRSASAGRADGP